MYLEENKAHFFGPSQIPLGSSQEASFLILVEDLSPPLIDLLGSYLSIPHWVFMQHSSGGELVEHGESCRQRKKKGPDAKCAGCRNQARIGNISLMY
jgi:hypothetical protein